MMAAKPAGADVSALVELPLGVDAETLGLIPIVPGIAVLHGDGARIAGFVLAHSNLPIEIAPPLRTDLDLAVPFIAAERARLGWPGQPGAIDGKGVYVGVVDTGIDIFHPDFHDASGKTRIAWLLDLAQKPRDGNDLDQKYGGRVFSKNDLDLLIAAGARVEGVPDDGAGHGTHVTGIAAGNGGAAGVYVGVAPSADLVIVRATRDDSGSLSEADAVTGVKFVFDMAKKDARPAVVNLSIGSQFGPHDGTSIFEQALVQLGRGPGRAIVVAASNEGEVFGTQTHPLPHGVHTSLRISPHTTFEVPLVLDGPNGTDQRYRAAQIFVWLNFRDGGEARVGLKGPDGSKWLDPVSPGEGYQVNEGSVVAQIVNDVHDNGAIPRGTHGATISFRGPLSPGRYGIVLEGDAAVEAWTQGVGDASDQLSSPYFSTGPQIEGTIGIPASADGLIAVGCVGVRPYFRVGITKVIGLDPPGVRCFFSSAGPSATGGMRPDVLAPGYYVVSSLAGLAFARIPNGEFTKDQIVDNQHAALSGTSMSSPFGAGAAALLLEKDPTLTMEDIRAAFMAGARPLADDSPPNPQRDYSKGAGILDVQRALAALDAKKDVKSGGPKATSLRLRVGGSFVPNDGQEPVWVVGIAQDDAGMPANIDDLTLVADGAKVSSPLDHPIAGLYRFSIVAVPGTGGTNATIGFRSSTTTVTREVAVAADRWDAHYGLTAAGGCSLDAKSPENRAWISIVLAALIPIRRRRARSRAAPSVDRPAPTGAPGRRC